MLKKYLVVLLFLPLVGIAAETNQSIKSDAPPEETIAVPDTELGLIGRINFGMEGLGWHLVAYQSGQAAGLKTEVDEERLTRLAKYRLEAVASQVGVCLNLERHWLFELRLIENATGETVIERSGRGCEITTADRFIQRMRAKDLVVEENRKGPTAGSDKDSASEAEEQESDN